MYNDMFSRKGIIQLRICPEQVDLEQKSIFNSYINFFQKQCIVIRKSPWNSS